MLLTRQKRQIARKKHTALALAVFTALEIVLDTLFVRTNESFALKSRRAWVV